MTNKERIKDLIDDMCSEYDTDIDKLAENVSKLEDEIYELNEKIIELKKEIENGTKS